MLNKKILIFVALVGILGFVIEGPGINLVSSENSGVKRKPVTFQTPEMTKSKLGELVKRCNDGDSESCLIVGYIHLRGVVGERDFGQAKNWFEKACDEVPEADQREIQCEAIAKIFETGKEARVDRKIAQIFHEKAKAAHLNAISMVPQQKSDVGEEDAECSKGNMGSCVQLAEKYEFGRRGVSMDLDKAGKIYQKACEYGNAMICDLAGTFFRNKGTNTRVAIALYQRGCKIGSSSACDHLRKLGGNIEDSL
jgi:uncharacterized protein